jgi:AraC family transcriptional regulator
LGYVKHNSCLVCSDPFAPTPFLFFPNREPGTFSKNGVARLADYFYNIIRKELESSMNVGHRTYQEYQESFKRVLIYIQKNLDQELSLETLAKIACFSPYHFHRIFKAFFNEPLYLFVKRLRLEQAARDIMHTHKSITTIALDTGYETPASFAKAFKQYFRHSPSEFRTKKQLENFNFTQNIKKNYLKKEYKMNFEILKISAQKVLFVKKIGVYTEAANLAWPVLMKFAYSHKLMQKDTKLIGISYDDPNITDATKLRYDACITISKDIEVSGEIGIQTIEGGYYAVFLHKGAYDKLGETYNAIFNSWLLESKNKLRNAPCFDVYLNRDSRRTKPENLRTEIYVPIEKV